jgi:glycosyltransferase involved in cell wall biosynthesis
LVDALVQGMEMSVDERKAIGLNGRNLVETKYTWEAIAKQMVSLYQWILGGDLAPECVKFC